MDKQEPRIIAGDLNDEELLQWMARKVEAAGLLKDSLSLLELSDGMRCSLDMAIETHTRDAAIEVIRSENVAHKAVSAPAVETVNIDKELFKQLLQLVLKLPDLGSHLATVNIDPGSATTGEILISLEPSDILLRLNTALGACR